MTYRATVSSHLVLCQLLWLCPVLYLISFFFSFLILLFFPFTMLCKVVLAKPWHRKKSLYIAKPFLDHAQEFAVFSNFNGIIHQTGGWAWVVFVLRDCLFIHLFIIYLFIHVRFIHSFYLWFPKAEVVVTHLCSSLSGNIHVIESYHLVTDGTFPIDVNARHWTSEILHDNQLILAICPWRLARSRREFRNLARPYLNSTNE